MSSPSTRPSFPSMRPRDLKISLTVFIVNLLKEFAPRLHAHVADRVAPVAVVGGAADGANVNGVGGTGRQAAEKHPAGLRKQAAALPRAGRTARSDRGLLQFERPGVHDLFR